MMCPVTYEETMLMNRCGLAIAILLIASLTLDAQKDAKELGIKYMRDSEEYATLTRQVYRSAGDAVDRGASAVSGPWAVVMDIDETTLDTTTYSLERAAYGLPFDDASFRAWTERRQATPIPGVVGFISHIRQVGGHIAWISNREAAVIDATRDNLKWIGLWNDDDRLCLQKTPEHTKAQRRRELISGQGECSWPNRPIRVVAFVGDQLGDFPDASEGIPNAGDDNSFGRTCFLLPNSMYGPWTTHVTRVVPHVKP